MVLVPVLVLGASLSLSLSCWSSLSARGCMFDSIELIVVYVRFAAVV